MSEFIRNCWYVAAWEHEVVRGEAVGRTLLGDPVVLWRDGSGEVHAMADRCPHRHAPLSLGRVEGDRLRCQYHGLLFAADGICLAVPGSDIIPPNCAVATYPLVVRDSWVWVWMGDPALADPALVPKAFGLDDPAFTMQSHQIDYKAHYMLINDNLCDLSHVDFVHETTLGRASGGGWSDEVPRILPRERGLRVERWFTNKPASPTNPMLVDTWSTYDYLVPGVFIMENRSFRAGAAAAAKGQAPTAEPMTYRVEQQAVTPISDRETRYFYATGFDARIPAKVLDEAFATVIAAFAEDRTIIEGQQAIWDKTPRTEPMAFIAHDKGPAMFRRIIERSLRAEKTSQT